MTALEHIESVLQLNLPADVRASIDLSLLDRYPDALDSVQRLWEIMDLEWERVGADFSAGSERAVDEFYRSPIWLLNGIFTEVDPESIRHRSAICDYVASLQPRMVVDYGGGFGALSRRVAFQQPSSRVLVIEPYPHPLALHLAADVDNLSFCPELPEEADLVIAQDVLEHVIDPVDLFGKLLNIVNVGGHVITANCFQPVIACHYPGAFHLNFTFSRIAPKLGCEYIGNVPGAPHAQIFRKSATNLDWRSARRLEALSRRLYPLFVAAQKAKRAVLR